VPLSSGGLLISNERLISSEMAEAGACCAKMRRRPERF
jgi:hypothetical protein